MCEWVEPALGMAQHTRAHLPDDPGNKAALADMTVQRAEPLEVDACNRLFWTNTASTWSHSRRRATMPGGAHVYLHSASNRSEPQCAQTPEAVVMSWPKRSYPPPLGTPVKPARDEQLAIRFLARAALSVVRPRRMVPMRLVGTLRGRVR